MQNKNKKIAVYLRRHCEESNMSNMVCRASSPIRPVTLNVFNMWRPKCDRESGYFLTENTRHLIHLVMALFTCPTKLVFIQTLCTWREGVTISEKTLFVFTQSLQQNVTRSILKQNADALNIKISFSYISCCTKSKDVLHKWREKKQGALGQNEIL